MIGDGKLGLLVAQMLVLQGHAVTHFGKHKHKLGLVSGTRHEVVTDQTAEAHAAVSLHQLSGQHGKPLHLLLLVGIRHHGVFLQNIEQASINRTLIILWG